MSQIEIDEMFRLVGDIRAKVTTNDTVPRGVVFLVEFLLNEGCDVLFDVVLVQCLDRCVDGIVLHLFRHISILDHCFLFGHLDLWIRVIEY